MQNFIDARETERPTGHFFKLYADEDGTDQEDDLVAAPGLP